MKYGKQILARFGLFTAQGTEAPDAFDLRLQRIGSRERRLNMRRALFRPRLQPLAA
jgi:hypothetical protein